MKSINLKESAKFVNQDILKQKMKHVYIVEQKNMEALIAVNVDMMKMKKI